MSAADSLMRSLAKKLVIMAMLALLALTYTAPARSAAQGAGNSSTVCAPGESQETIRLHHGAPVEVAMQTSYDPSTRRVRIALEPKDADDEFISAFRPQDFVVYEDGAAQVDPHVTVERPPVAIGILIEHGGRYQMLNDAISEESSLAAQQLLEEIRSGDRVAVWTYGDKLREIAGLSGKRDTLVDALNQIDGPLPLSESNLYDALIGTLATMQKVSGPKALLLISSGVDTFSHSSLGDVLRAARCSGVPVYAIDLAPLLKHELFEDSDNGPYGRLDWSRAKVALERIAKTSGGRLYVPQSELDLPGDYDDLMEDVRARYLITYRSESTRPPNSERTVRVELRAEANAGPFRVAMKNGRPGRTMIAVRGSYLPTSILAGNNAQPQKR